MGAELSVGKKEKYQQLVVRGIFALGGNRLNIKSCIKKLRNILLCIVLVLFIITIIRIVLSGEAIHLSRRHAFDYKNFTLEMISEEQIVGIIDNKVYKPKSRSLGASTGVEEKRYQEYDYDQKEFEAEKVSGIIALSATKARDCMLHIIVESTLETGEMKLVVVIDKEAIVEYIPVGEKVDLYYTVEGEHTYYVKALCDEAKVNVTVTREITSL